MGTTMKGLLKGLRYISQIFEEGEDKEPQMEIGFPTDVKHVAHIGWDGPSTTAPSWMNEFKSTPLSAGSEGADAAPKVPTTEFQPTGDSPPPRPRSSRRKDSSTNPDSPGRESTKPSRRRPSTGAVPMDGNGEGSTRHGRRNRSGSGGSSSTGIESPPPSSSSSQQDLPAVPKQSRRRKTKDSTSGGSSRSSRNKAPESGYGERGVPELQALPSMPEREEVVHGGF